MSQTKLTRRQWAGALAVSTQVAAAAAARTPAQPDSPADLLAQAKQSAQHDREVLAKFKIDRSLEPATRFEA